MRTLSPFRNGPPSGGRELVVKEISTSQVNYSRKNLSGQSLLREKLSNKTFFSLFFLYW
jgi:hypothetical protein